MAVTTGIYRERVLSNFNGLCLLLGLRVDNNSSIPLYDFLVESKSRFREYYSQENLFDATLKVEASVAEIAKIGETCSFSYISLLDFTMYDRIDYLLSLVLAYQDVNCITAYMEIEIKELIEFMTLLEKEKGPNFKNTLSYMAIRNFLMFLVNKKFLHASCYATFIKEQIFLSEGLSPKLEFTDVYKNELALSIRKERARYTNQIRNKLKKSVKSIINTTYDPNYSNDYKDHEDYIKKTKVSKKSKNDISYATPDIPTQMIRGINSDEGSFSFNGKILRMRDSDNGNSISNIRSKVYIRNIIKSSHPSSIDDNNISKESTINIDVLNEDIKVPREDSIKRTINLAKLSGVYKSNVSSNSRRDSVEYNRPVDYGRQSPRDYGKSEDISTPSKSDVFSE